MSDYGQKPGRAPDFRFGLSGGHMVYTARDTWSVWSDTDGKIGEIDANEYPTIREFKQWAQKQIDGE